MATIELKRVAKRYGQHSVIENLDLTIVDGSFTVFVGPSGCGKSTLLRMIAGLEEISAGTLLIGGMRANDATPVARGVAMVFQNYALYPHMTVAENIGFGLKMAGLPRQEIASRVAAAAGSLHIENLMARRPSALSGGQRQRVAIGRAIVREPTVFLFDEPLSNLDAELRVVMRVEIAKLHRQLGTTMIYVTHDQIEAMTLADRIVVMRDGRIEQQGSPDELYTNPANIFVAGFIGSPRMNFLRAQSLGGGRIRLEAGGEIVRPELILPEGTGVTVGIRPEHLGPPDAGATLEGLVEVVENLGGTRYVYTTLVTGETLVAEMRNEAGGFAVGEQMRFEPVSSKLHIFGSEGLAL